MPKAFWKVAQVQMPSRAELRQARRRLVGKEELEGERGRSKRAPHGAWDENASLSETLQQGDERLCRARPRAFTDRAPRSRAPGRGGAGGGPGAGPRARASRREGVTQREAARGGGRGGRVLEVELRAGTGSFAAIFCPTKQPIGDGSQPGLHWRFVSRFGQ